MGESHIIIGDGIAGASAAEAIVEADADVDVTILTDESEPLYNRILIKEHAKGKLPEAPISIHNEDWYADRDIDLRLGTRVSDIHADSHEIVTAGGDTIQYDKLLVATGGTPTRLPVPNADVEGVHYFWTFDDARRIRDAAEYADNGVVVGAGLLGIDFAAICGAQDIDADYLMRGDRWWRYGLSKDGAEIIHEQLRDMGVTPQFNSGVERFETGTDGRLEAVVDTNGERYQADFAGVAIGLDYNTDLTEGTPVEVDGGILVDERMATSAEDVYAAGDITRFYDPILGERNQNGSWDSAQEQGRVAARNMLGEDAEFHHVPSYSITHFDVPFLSFGHPTRGESYCERRYSDTEWRRLAFNDGKIVGGVLIGDLAPQRIYKQLMEVGAVVEDCEDLLLEKQVDDEAFDL